MMAKPFKNGFSEQPHPMRDEIDDGEVGGHGRLPYSPERRGTNNVNNKCYSNKRIATAIAVSIAIFISVLLIADAVSGDTGMRTRYRQYTLHEIMTPAERKRFRELYRSGRITDADIPIFAERFSRAPNRENAFDQALDASFGAKVAREWADIKEATPIIGDAGIGIEATERHFEEHGLGKGLYKIAESAVTAPFRAWGSVLSGQGLGERPLRTSAALLLGALIFGKILIHLGRVVLARVVRPFILLILPLPNICWQFTLDRIRELSRAIRGEE